MASSPLARRGLTANSCFLPPFSPQLMFHVIGGKDVVVWEEKPQKPETDLSANQRRFITNNNNNNNRKLKKKKKNDWLLSSSKSLNSPNFTVQPLQLDELGKNRNLYHCSWVGRTLNLPVYFGDAVSREVLYKVGAERVCAAAITLDTPGSNYRTVWALNKLNYQHQR